MFSLDIATSIRFTQEFINISATLSMLLAKILDKIVQNVFSPLRKEKFFLSFIKANLFRLKKIFSRHVKHLAQMLFQYVCVLCEGCMLKKFVKKAKL